MLALRFRNHRKVWRLIRASTWYAAGCPEASKCRFGQLRREISMRAGKDSGKGCKQGADQPDHQRYGNDDNDYPDCGREFLVHRYENLH